MKNNTFQVNGKKLKKEFVTAGWNRFKETTKPLKANRMTTVLPDRSLIY
jgi:hypothetical protein